VLVASYDYINIKRELEAFFDVLCFCAYNFSNELAASASDLSRSASFSDEEAYLVLNMLSDSKSKKIFEKILEKRKNRTYMYFDICEGDQYFIPEIISRFSDDEVYVDGGPCTGREIDLFLKLRSCFSKIYAFEPNQQSFRKIKEKYSDDRIVVHQLGLYEENVVLPFFMDGTPSCSRIADVTCDTKVNLVKLDDFIGEKVTFIKMDIEGAEMSALKGAENIIKHCRPKLAICVYHKSNDIVEIPLYVKSLVPEYNILMRHHSAVNNETVMYAYV
jgi:FkbM family methyltransferase